MLDERIKYNRMKQMDTIDVTLHLYQYAKTVWYVYRLTLPRKYLNNYIVNDGKSHTT